MSLFARVLERVLAVVAYVCAYVRAFAYSAYLRQTGATPLQAQSITLARHLRTVTSADAAAALTSPEVMGVLKVSNRKVRLLDGELVLSGGVWEWHPDSP